MVTVIERLSTFTPLGIRFWDPALDAHIRDHLRVEAHPERRTQAVVRAGRTRGDVYAFGHLPGLRHIEYGNAGVEPGSPPQRHSFVVCVADDLGRYLPIAFEVQLPLPYRGVYLSGSAGSPADAAPCGLHLYSAPDRPVPVSATAIRGELQRADDGAPAAHAIVRVETESGEVWHGVSDVRGRFVVTLPYPTLTHGFGGSPSSLGHRPLFEQVWLLVLSVLYEPGAQRELTGAGVPDYLSVLEQAQAEIYEQSPDTGGMPVTSIPVQLRFDRHPTVRTEGLSQLLVNPSTASP